MFDLIGYWGIVTLHTLLLVSPIFIFSTLAMRVLLSQALGREEYVRYFKHKMDYVLDLDYGTLFGKDVHDGMLFLWTIVSFIILIYTTLAAYCKYNIPVWQIIPLVADKLHTAGAYITIFIIGYLLTLLVIRKGYKFYKLIRRLEDV